MLKLWHRLFLDERPSVSLAFFRIFAALTTGFHVIPSFFHLGDNYLSTAFKELNGQFFTMDVLRLVQKSPDALVVFFVALFCASWFFFLIGFFSQFSCIVMTACCYYFYALNAFPIGTLSWDILLVTLFLLCLTPYPGDYFSVDSFKSPHPEPFKRLRPYFIQRLLQMQIASVFFYTALYKTTAQGNWLNGNPIYYLMNYPPPGVVKFFLFKDWLAVHPEICYAIGVLIVIVEFFIGFLWFIPATRVSAIYAGIFFHIVLILTLDVPAIFFFLFPVQMLLFINSKDILKWIKSKRYYNKSASRPKLLYDGHCGFCRESVRKLKVTDMFAVIEYVDFQAHPDIPALHPHLTKEKLKSQIYLVMPHGPHDECGVLYGGFFAIRHLCLMMPMLYPLILLFYFPGAGIVGPMVYSWVAKNRYLFHANKTCKNNACFR